MEAHLSTERGFPHRVHRADTHVNVSLIEVDENDLFIHSPMAGMGGWGVSILETGAGLR